MATKQIQWDDGSGDHILLTYKGHGDGTVTAISDFNNGAARSKTIVIETIAGSPVVTKNLTIRQEASPVPVGTVLNYAYTGSYKEVELPAGQYKLQCWGAQGGSNAAASSYSITAKAGGKGGYSEGVLTLTSKTTVRIYVGGAGSSSSGGYNGGGSTTGTSQYNSGGTLGYTKMGGGGGATDIRLSDGSLYSRMIVAGGGSGGAMGVKRITESLVGQATLSYSYDGGTNEYWYCINGNYSVDATSYGIEWGKTYRVEIISSGSFSSTTFIQRTSGGSYVAQFKVNANNMATISSQHSTGDWLRFATMASSKNYTATVKFYLQQNTDTTVSQVGYVGGGTTGAAYTSTYQATQTAAGFGTGAGFGVGANQTVTANRYASGAGGGGWYGGGGGASDTTDTNYIKRSGGGSGWVNTSASSGNRPSGYTGLELDSGTTYAGNTSFPSTSGGTETGHSGNGYARITRLS